MNYDNPEGKYPQAKLTEPQLKFLRRCANKPETVWPGTDTRVANGLARLGLVTVRNDIAALTTEGREKLAELTPKQTGNKTADTAERDHFVETLTAFLSSRLAIKSIHLVISGAVKEYADEWAALRNSIPGVFGYQSAEKTEAAIRRFLGW